MLAIGSAVVSLYNPRRADMIAALSEATCSPFFINALLKDMLSTKSGRRVLRDRPRITSTSLNLSKLRSLPAGSVGKEYINWLDLEHVSPDTRAPVRYIDDPELAYVMQRYRESHDFYHAITGLPVFIEGEIALKWFEWCNMRLPVAALSALFAPVKLPSSARERLREIYIPWAVRNGLKAKSLIGVYWEEELETSADELRARLGIERPPDLRDLRRRQKKGDRI